MIRAIIIEDDPMVLEINKNYLLSNKSIKLIGTFCNGFEALDFLKENPNVDLALVDCYMPKLDGLSFLKKIRDLGIELEVIMITAANDTESIAKAVRLGVIDYLVKPFEYNRFQESINKFLKKFEILKEKRSFNQNQIDSIFKNHCEAENPKNKIKYEKGINPKTLKLIMRYFEKNVDKKITSDELSAELSLSAVTIRRYLNYLVEHDNLEFEIDYETGGRPSNKYYLI